ncbi:NYN domain-containing protein [Nonomuraea sp. NPDC059194]|uniref:NYN domain-containing protein n=1 Tax=Nonomuraea sp. NPDC059194 TaxID=3346764 RepID=UPI0036C0FE8D
MDRCALFVDAGYLLADGAMAVHGTRHREAVSWDYPGLLQLMSNLSRERTGLPLLRCYWYEATIEGRRTPEHDVLADLPGLKLRLSRIRPGRREGVDAQVHRDLMTLARNSAICDAVVVSGDEDLAQVVCDAQDLGIRVTVVHIAADGSWAVSRSLRQESDDLIEIGGGHLRPYVTLVSGSIEAGNGASVGAVVAGSAGAQSVSNGQAAHALPPSPPLTPSPTPLAQPTSPLVQPSLPSVQSGNHAAHLANAPTQSQPLPPVTPTPPAPSRAQAPPALPAYPSYQPEPSSVPQQPSLPPQPTPLPPTPSQPPAAPTVSHSPTGPMQSTSQFPSPASGGTYQPAQLGPYTGPQPAPVAAAPASGGATTLADAVKAAHKEGHDFGESVARDAPALWLEAVLARKPRMPSDLEARLLQGSSLPIDFLLHDEVRHALRRGFWDALERARR